MRVRILRNLGRNLPPPIPDDGDGVIEELTQRDEPLVEGNEVDLADNAAKYLQRNLLAEEVMDQPQRDRQQAERQAAEQREQAQRQQSRAMPTPTATPQTPPRAEANPTDPKPDAAQRGARGK